MKTVTDFLRFNAVTRCDDGHRSPESFLVCADPASAHTGTGLPGHFISGFKHPFSGIDHMLAMLAVGLWGAFLGRPLIFALPVIFPFVMVAGAILGMVGAPLPPVEIGIALSVTVLGGCIAAALKAPVFPASLVVAIFACSTVCTWSGIAIAADPIGYMLGLS